MKTAIALLLALAVGTAQAGCQWSMKNDSLRYTQDKRWHFEQTMLGTLALQAVNEAADLELSNTSIFWLGVLPGFIHELGTACDGKRQRSQAAFSHEDMVWNMAGSLVAVGIGHGVRIMLQPRGVQVHLEF